MTFNKFFIILLLALSWSFSCVRYSFKGALPSYLKTIYIADFENETAYPGVQQEFMQKVTEAFIKDNSLTVINNEKDADLVLSGAITSIDRRPVSITQQEQVQEYQMVVNIKAECLNTHINKPLWGSTLSRFSVIPGAALRTDIDTAISDDIDQIVDDIINNTIAAW
ncbi:MAG: LptE family protein [Calditrichia bacterium]